MTYCNFRIFLVIRSGTIMIFTKVGCSFVQGPVYKHIIEVNIFKALRKRSDTSLVKIKVCALRIHAEFNKLISPLHDAYPCPRFTIIVMPGDMHRYGGLHTYRNSSDISFAIRTFKYLHLTRYDSV